RRHEEKLSLGIKKTPDEPARGRAVDSDTSSCDPLHRRALLFCPVKVYILTQKYLTSSRATASGTDDGQERNHDHWLARYRSRGGTNVIRAAFVAVPVSG